MDDPDPEYRRVRLSPARHGDLRPKERSLVQLKPTGNDARLCFYVRVETRLGVKWILLSSYGKVGA